MLLFAVLDEIKMAFIELISNVFLLHDKCRWGLQELA